MSFVFVESIIVPEFIATKLLRKSQKVRKYNAKFM